MRSTALFTLSHGGNTVALVGEDRQAGAETHKRWWRHLVVAVAVCALLLAIFHRPILLALGRQMALHYAAKENLKITFRLEGNVFTNLTVRNLHAFPTGPSAIESIDIDRLYVDYSLFGLARHGLSQFLDNVEARSARIVLNPAKAPLKPRPPKAKMELPSLFPERIRLTDATLVIKNQPHDFVADAVDLDLNPRSPGDLRIEKLQLPAGDSWSNVSGQSSYTNKNLIIRDLVLSDQEQIHLLNVDASHIEAKALGIVLTCAIGGGELSISATLTETKSSLDTKIHVAAEKIAMESLNKFLSLPARSFSGEIERLALDGTGVMDMPRTWSGTISLQMSDVHRPEIDFNSGVVEVSAEQGKATLRSADIVQDKNEFHLRGTAEMPANFKDFGRSPASLEIAGTAADLRQLTAGLAQPITGRAQFDGRIDIVNAQIEANLKVTADSVGFSNGTIEKLSATAKASKIMPPADVKKPWFADLRLRSNLNISNAHYRDCVIDSVEGAIDVFDDVVSLEPLNLRRNQNELVVRGQYRLPEEVGKVVSQPAALDFSLNAPEAGDFRWGSSRFRCSARPGWGRESGLSFRSPS